MFSKGLPSVLKFNYTGYLTHLYIEMCKNNYLFTDYDMDEIYDMYNIVVHTDHDVESNTKGKFNIKMVRKDKGFSFIWYIIKKTLFIGSVLMGCLLLAYLMGVLLMAYNI